MAKNLKEWKLLLHDLLPFFTDIAIVFKLAVVVEINSEFKLVFNELFTRNNVLKYPVQDENKHKVRMLLVNLWCERQRRERGTIYT